MVWTDDQLETLKTLWAGGCTAREIAAEVGAVSRSAVLGKVLRLGLMGQGRPRRPPAARKPRASRTIARTAAVAPPVAPARIDDASIPFAQRKSLFELSDATCRWPVGDPATELFFCGGEPATGSPYCLWHSHVAVEPATRRSQRRPPIWARLPRIGVR
jgi:GcrA cell cycle regulator